MKIFKNENGFTMIELIIVIALIAIIGAMLVPSFTQTTIRAKLKTDINGIRVVQNALDLYIAETNKSISDANIEVLIQSGYLDKPKVQSKGEYKIDASDKKVHLVLSNELDDKMLKYVEELGSTEISGKNDISIK